MSEIKKFEKFMMATSGTEEDPEFIISNEIEKKRVWGLIPSGKFLLFVTKEEILVKEMSITDLDQYQGFLEAMSMARLKYSQLNGLTCSINSEAEMIEVFGEPSDSHIGKLIEGSLETRKYVCHEGDSIKLMDSDEEGHFQ